MQLWRRRQWLARACANDAPYQHRPAKAPLSLCLRSLAGRRGPARRLPSLLARRCLRWPAAALLSILHCLAGRSGRRGKRPTGFARNAPRRTDAGAVRADDVEGRHDHSSGRSNRPRPTGRWPRSARAPPRFVGPGSGCLKQRSQLRMSLALVQRPGQPPSRTRPHWVTL